eukprot:scaffold28705_cov22-Tisochrysis_lutea.AAC.1
MATTHSLHSFSSFAGLQQGHGTDASNLEVAMTFSPCSRVPLQDRKGCIVLMHAAAHGHDRYGSTVLMHAAHGRDRNGRTALMHAAACGHERVIMAIIAYHPSLNMKDAKSGMTALMLATSQGHAKPKEKPGCSTLSLDAMPFVFSSTCSAQATWTHLHPARRLSSQEVWDEVPSKIISHAPTACFIVKTPLKFAPAVTPLPA